MTNQLSTENSGYQGKSKFAAKLILVALTYFACGRLGLAIPYLGSHITLIWLPAGIAVAVLLRWGYIFWPGIFLGALAVNFSIDSSPLLDCSIALGNTLAPLLSVWLLRRLKFQTSFDRAYDILLFAMAAAIGMLASASSGVSSLVLFKVLPVQDAGAAWLSWWAGDLVGVLLAAPLLLNISRAELKKLWAQRVEFVAWSSIMFAMSWSVFFLNNDANDHSLPLVFMVLPVVVWSAMRFSLTGSSLGVLLPVVIAAMATSLGLGPFHTPDVRQGLFLLWLFLATLVLIGLMVAALQAGRKRAEETLQRSEADLRLLLTSVAEGIYGVDMQGCCTFINPPALRLLGYQQESDLLGKQMHDLIHHTHTDGTHYPATECRLYHCLQSHEEIHVDDELFWRKDGSSFPVDYWSRPVMREGEVVGAVVTFLDITERKLAQLELQHNQDLLNEAQQLGQLGSWELNLLSGELRWSDEVYRIFELDPARFSPSYENFLNVIHPDDRDKVNQAYTQSLKDRQPYDVEHRLQLADGRIKWVREHCTSEFDVLGKPLRSVGAVQDVTENKKSEQEIHQLAFYDSLTMLPNRRLLLDRLQQALAVSARNGRHGALLFLDLDHFKTINDTQGHAMGDQLLIEVARRLRTCVREGDSVARLGGDEFVVVLEDLSNEVDEAATQTELVAEKIRIELGQPYILKDYECLSTVSVGISLFSGHPESVEDLLKHADVAMYQAKTAGRNAIRFFDPHMQTALDMRAALEADLRYALEKQQFRLYYQIQVDNLRRPLGAEVLLRWDHPERGLVSPLQFIPLAEETGLIVLIGLWVLQTACAQLKEWQNDALTRDLTLAVNVSAKQFRQADCVAQVQRVLLESGAKPSHLKLELTESIVLENVEDTISKMREIKALGVSFSMDDFGTGYSSLQYLKRLPLDQIKIDQSFVRDIATDPNDAAIAQTIIAMTETLGLKVIAEGVETEAQQEFLELRGCHAFQGYLFGKPVPLDQFEGTLRGEQ